MNKTKVCTKCKIEKNVSCFYKDRYKKDGLTCHCKNCHRQYQKNNTKPIAKYHKQYNVNNAPQIAKQRKQYRENNSEKIAKQRKQYNENNPEKIISCGKLYRKNNFKKISNNGKQHDKKIALFESYSEKLKVFEETRRYPENLELLQVRCAYCGKWILPTNRQVKTRIQVFNGTLCGENRFYCSENCKQSCPVFRKILWPKGFKKATSREVVPLLRQLVLERDNYTCQKCGATTETAQLHVHHEKSYTLNKIMANDPDNCITLCKECHRWIHSQDGCRYNDLKC